MTVTSCPMGAPVAESFDHNGPDYAQARYESYQDLRRDLGPVFWSPSNGGYWVVIGWEELTTAAKDWARFSSKSLQDGEDGLHFNGLFIPPRPGAGRLLQEDPPEWSQARKAMAPLFTPRAVEAWRERMQTLVDACLDRRIETGHIDFATDLANVIPAVFSLELVGLSAEHHVQVARNHHLTSHLAADDPGWIELGPSLQAEKDRIAEAIQQQKTDRQPGVISFLLDARDDGAEFSDADIASLAMLTIGGGIDTTAALLGSAFVLMGRQPELKQQLLDQPDVIGSASEEFMRYAAPTQGLCRTVTRDTELGGQQLRRGDRVMLCFAAASRDPRTFAEAESIDMTRSPNRHVAFGSGIHRCIGAQFAKLEFELTIPTVLRRMPDFNVDVSQARSYDNVGIVAGWTSVPATFTPGPSLGTDPGIPGWDT